jgi:alpha-maltose-1-phosphate synthase
MRVLFVNENIAGHATVHHHLRATMDEAVGIHPVHLDVPRPGLGRRVVGASVPGLGRLDLDLQPLRAQLAAAHWVRRRIPDLVASVDAVHVYTHNAGLLSTGLLARVPTVVSLDTTNAHNASRLPYRRPTWATPFMAIPSIRLERRVHRAATTVVANSAWAAQSLRHHYGVPEGRLRVLPFGIVAPDFGRGPAPGTCGSRRPTIVFVGRQLERKGALDLLRVHQRSLASRADLVLVTTERLVPPPGVTVVDDIRPGDGRLWSLLRDAAVFAFPSPIDQAPNAVLEAMAAGLPVVACDVAALPEMLDHGAGGILVPPGDDEALHRALLRLLDEPALRVAMGAANRRRFQARYDARSVAPALAGILRDAVARHTGAVPSTAGSCPWPRAS